METHDNDLKNVLEKDGVEEVIVGEMENLPTTNADELREKMGDGSWAARLVYNERFGGVLIQQQPGEGNRLHYHPDADECWVILEYVIEYFPHDIETKAFRQRNNHRLLDYARSFGSR